MQLTYNPEAPFDERDHWKPPPPDDFGWWWMCAIALMIAIIVGMVAFAFYS